MLYQGIVTYELPVGVVATRIKME